MTKERKKRYDWEKIDHEIRAGALSIREISRRHGPTEGAIRRRMRESKVSRDLTREVRKQARAKLMTPVVAQESAPLSDEEIVDKQSDMIVQALRSHRKDIRSAAQTVSLLQTQLMQAVEDRDRLMGEINESTEVHIERLNLQKAVNLPAHSLVAKNLAVALKHLVVLERQSLSIDEQPDESADAIELTADQRRLFKAAAEIVSRRIIEQTIRDD